MYCLLHYGSNLDFVRFSWVLGMQEAAPSNLPSDSPSGLTLNQPLTRFTVDQIVCLESGDRRLFAEVVQVIEERSRCWVRPLALAEVQPTSLVLNLCYDLRESSHLVLAQHFFRAALDTEVMPLLSALYQSAKSGEEADQVCVSETQRALYLFVQDLFSPSIVQG